MPKSSKKEDRFLCCLKAPVRTGRLNTMQRIQKINDSKQPDWSDIRQIIEKHYARQPSRYLLGGRKNASVWEYYYNPEEFESAVCVASLIENNMFRIPSDIDHISFQLHPDGKTVKTRCPSLMKLKETNGFYEIDCYAVTGYEAVRSYGDRTALRLRYFESPVLKLVLSRKYGSLMQKTKHGNLAPFYFSWWVNRLLLENDSFRLFFTELIEKMGRTKYIYRDVARCIGKHHYCLIDVPVQQMEHYYNPEALIRGITKTTLKIDFNKKNLNYSLWITKIAEMIAERDWGILLSLDDEMVMSWFSSDSSLPGFVKCFYQSVWGVSYETGALAEEYARVCLDNGERVSLRIASVKRMREKVEEKYRRLALLEDNEAEDLVPYNSRFNKLGRNLPDGFEWITSKTRLFMEGRRQHNCVYTYRGEIRQDNLAILHWEKDSRPYTIEVGIGSDGYYRIHQMKGLCNKEPQRDDYYIAALKIGRINAFPKPSEKNIDIETMLADIETRLGIPVVVE